MINPTDAKWHEYEIVKEMMKDKREREKCLANIPGMKKEKYIKS